MHFQKTRCHFFQILESENFPGFFVFAKKTGNAKIINIEKENSNNKYITQKDLEDQTQVIVSAVDTLFNKHKKEVNKRFSEVNGRFSEVNERIDEMNLGLGEKIDKLQTQIDGYIKAQENFKDEHIIVKEEIKQMKNVFRDNPGVEISAV